MKRLGAAGLLVLVLAARAGAEQPGREAVVHLRDGTVIACVVLGYADGQFRVREDGAERRIDVDAVDKVAFGKAVGDYVRDPFGVEERAEPDAPGPRPNGRGELRRRIENLLRALDERQLVVVLARWTDQFRDPELVRRAEAGIRRMLSTAPVGDDLNRNLRLATAVLKIAQGSERAAERILGELRRDYPKDLLLRRLRVAELRRGVDAVRRARPELRRPGARLRRPSP